MFKLGLTGSLGVGKSTVAKYFIRQGIPVFEADHEVHKLYDNPIVIQSILRSLEGRVPRDKNLRQNLAKLVLVNPLVLPKLEEVLHPIIKQLEQEFFDKNSGQSWVISDIPLLLEKGLQSRYDGVMMLTAPWEVLWERVQKRPGMTQEKFYYLLKKQMNEYEKKDLATWVVSTDCDLKKLYHALDSWVYAAYQHGQGQFNPNVKDKVVL